MQIEWSFTLNDKRYTHTLLGDDQEAEMVLDKSVQELVKTYIQAKSEIDSATVTEED